MDIRTLSPDIRIRVAIWPDGYTCLDGDVEEHIAAGHPLDFTLHTVRTDDPRLRGLGERLQYFGFDI